MEWELILWLFSFAGIIALFGMSAFQLISLADLEFDYINPYDSSSRINALVMPEFFIQGIMCGIFLLTWHWFPFLVMAPITYYHVKLFTTKRHLIDVTEIYRMLNAEKKYRMIKLAFYFSIFIIVMCRLVMTAVKLMEGEHVSMLEAWAQ